VNVSFGSKALAGLDRIFGPLARGAAKNPFVAGIALITLVSGLYLTIYGSTSELAVWGYVFIVITAIIGITLMALGRKKGEPTPPSPPKEPVRSEGSNANATAIASLGGVASAGTNTGAGPQVINTIVLQPPAMPSHDEPAEVNRRQINDRLATPLPIDLTYTYDLPDKLGYTADDRAIVRKFLACAAATTARDLKVDPTLVRANVFGLCTDNQLRIIPDFMFNMNRQEEWSIALLPGEGGTGRCFQQRSAGDSAPTVTSGPQVKDINAVRESELRKAHPDLSWILSIPVYAPGWSGKCVWVLNVDGLSSTPAAENLERAGGQLFNPYSVFLTYSMKMHFPPQGGT